MKHLRVFGSKALAYVPREKRDKWDSKAQELIFIGYDENIKGYRLIDPRIKKITVSRDVIFREGHCNKISEKYKRTPENAIYQLTQESRDKDSGQDFSDEEVDESGNQDDVFPEADEDTEEAQEAAQEGRADQTGERRTQRNKVTPRRSKRK
ncbi:retrovirus-related pol polyprotein [Lasius niger]|uniref:Retrovirus-related pol polyprotein n=1 Tax=Lasius niger TaxID=67767 RepID=A0A0J7KC00_LASNI|nr:retrovirus-related pol polyprotein [Lasius niger]